MWWRIWRRSRGRDEARDRSIDVRGRVSSDRGAGDERAPAASRARAAELADVSRELQELAVQCARADPRGQRAQSGVEVGVPVGIAGEVRSDAAGGGWRDVLH